MDNFSILDILSTKSCTFVSTLLGTYYVPLWDTYTAPGGTKMFNYCCLTFVPFPYANVPLASKRARIKTYISKNNNSEKKTKAVPVHIIVSQTDQLQFNKQLNLIYKQKHRNTVMLNQMVRRKQIKYTNTMIPATINSPQQPVDAFTWSWWYAFTGNMNKYLTRANMINVKLPDSDFTWSS